MNVIQPMALPRSDDPPLDIYDRLPHSLLILIKKVKLPLTQ